MTCTWQVMLPAYATGICDWQCDWHARPAMRNQNFGAMHERTDGRTNEEPSVQNRENLALSNARGGVAGFRLIGVENRRAACAARGPMAVAR